MKISEDENTITIDGVFNHRALKETGPLDCSKCSFNQEPNDIYCPSVPCRYNQRKDGVSVYFAGVKNETKT